MPRNKLRCVYCSKVMREDNLKRHVKTMHLKNSCAAPTSSEENKLAGKKRSAVSDDDDDDDIATLDRIKVGSGKVEIVNNNQSRNLKIQNEILSKPKPAL